MELNVSVNNCEHVSKNKYTAITMQHRLEILRRLEAGATTDQVAAEYGISRRSAQRIKHNANEIHQLVEQGANLERKRKRESQFGDLDGHLYAWFLERRAFGDVITDAILQKKASELMQELGGPSTATASRGWIWRFKKRHDIWFSGIRDEKRDVSYGIAGTFCDNFKRRLKKDYIHPENIYNMDETGLIWKALPKTTLIQAGERRIDDTKMKKNRVTIGVCANSTGNHKLSLLFVHKYENPMALRHWKNNLPVVYKCEKNGSINRQLFTEWYKNHFKPEVRRYQQQKCLAGKVLLILDNCSYHVLPLEDTEDDDFEIVLLPANAIPIQQPMNQGIIEDIKKSFRQHLLLSILEFPGGVGQFYTVYDIKDCISMIHTAWTEVSPENIQNAWRKFLKLTPEIMNSPIDTSSTIEDLIAQIMGEPISRAELNDWFNFCAKAEDEIEPEEEVVVKTEQTISRDSLELEHDEIDRAFRVLTEWAETESVFAQFYLRILRDYYELK